MSAKQDLTGQIFGRLTVIRDVGRDTGKKVIWECLCSCGKLTLSTGGLLKRGVKKSCGCLNLDKLKARSTTHGLSKHPLYFRWKGMRARCSDNINSPDFKYYTGRGIYICDEWKEDFLTFYNWSLANGYEKGLSLDRIDNDGPYSPENCRWVDCFVQGNNRRDNVWITYNGECHTIVQWSNILNIPEKVLQTRLKKWPLERAMTEPLKMKRSGMDRFVEYKGEFKTIAALARELDIPYSRLHNSVRVKGNTVEEALQELNWRE